MEKWKLMFQKLGHEFQPGVRLIQLLSDCQNPPPNKRRKSSDPKSVESRVKQLLKQQGILNVTSVISSCSSSSDATSDDSSCQHRPVKKSDRTTNHKRVKSSPSQSTPASSCPNSDSSHWVSEIKKWLREPQDCSTTKSVGPSFVTQVSYDRQIFVFDHII